MKIKIMAAYLQRPTPSDICKNAPSISGAGLECVARGGWRRLKMVVT
jgi:hypothetical protein